MSKRGLVALFLATAVIAIGLAAVEHRHEGAGLGTTPARSVVPTLRRFAVQKTTFTPLPKQLGAPVAYGFVQYDGSLYAGSGNVTSEWHETGHRYYIRIAGVIYQRGPYITFVTPEGNGGIYFPATWDDNGALVICMGMVTGDTGAQAGFQFITYKLN